MVPKPGATFPAITHPVLAASRYATASFRDAPTTPQRSLRVAMLLLSALLTLSDTRHGIVFDAGSSGSRIHVYTWKTGGGGPKDQFELVEDDILKIKPGLSAYKDKPSDAGASLLPLLAHAKTKIPAEEIAKTPVFLMATAGLRMVARLEGCHLQSDDHPIFGFLFRCEWATLLDGRDEGLYGWVTVNYLLDTLYTLRRLAPPESSTSVVAASRSYSRRMPRTRPRSTRSSSTSTVASTTCTSSRTGTALTRRAMRPSMHWSRSTGVRPLVPACRVRTHAYAAPAASAAYEETLSVFRATPC